MFNYSKKRIFLMFSLCMLLLSITSVFATEKKFNKKDKIKIVHSSIEVYPPGEFPKIDSRSRIFQEFWGLTHRIDLDNHLYATTTCFYDQASYYEELADVEYKGSVNLIFEGPENRREAFLLVFEDGKELSVELWLNDTDMSYDLPKICSIEPHTKTIPHWFYNEKKREYLLGLTDNSNWSIADTKKIPNLCSRIMKIGTTSNPVLINIDSISAEYPLIGPNNYFVAEQK